MPGFASQTQRTVAQPPQYARDTVRSRNAPHAALKAIIFDLDGTLYTQRAVRLAMAFRLALYTARHPMSGVRVVRALRAYRTAQETLRRRGGASADLAAAQLAEAARVTDMEPLVLKGIVKDWFEEAPLDLFLAAMRPGLPDLLRWAAADGLRLGVLSDYPPAAKLRALGVADYFDLALSAQDPGIGCFKPDPRGILHMLDRWGIRPAECVFVGDRPDVDAEAARRAGVRCLIIGAAATVHGDYEVLEGVPALARALQRATVE